MHAVSARSAKKKIDLTISGERCRGATRGLDSRAPRGACRVFMQSEALAFAMLEVVANLHRYCGADPSEAVDHGPDQPIVNAVQLKYYFNLVEQLARLLGRQHPR